MSDEQRVGQLFMVGVDSRRADALPASLIRDRHVGNIIMHGPGWNGQPVVAAEVARLQALADRSPSRGVRLFVSGNQEGGEHGSLQTFYGGGFNDLPTAFAQGQAPPAAVQWHARLWGAQLAAAGVNLNLAPVMDIVPPGTVNDSIGQYGRQFGGDAATVQSHAVAFMRGMNDAGVAATLKHFPSMGHVVGNTDFTMERTIDATTTATSDDVRAFAAGINAGAGFVMASLATYTKIDAANPAVFSRVVLDDVLRRQLGFTGVTVSDDLSTAQAVSGVGVVERAVRFLGAGGDMVLEEHEDTVDVAPIVDGVIERARGDPSFQRRMRESVMRVLNAKEAAHLLSRTC